MCLSIEFDLRAEGDSLADAFLDEYELAQMFEGTRLSVGAGLERKFRDIVCGEHATAPKFKVSGIYDKQREQMDIQYHVDTCCQYFLMRVMQLLNRGA